MKINRRVHQVWEEAQELERKYPGKFPSLLGMFGKYQYRYETLFGSISLIHINCGFHRRKMMWEVYDRERLFDDVVRFKTKKEAEVFIRKVNGFPNVFWRWKVLLFSEEFDRVVEQKVTAEQQMLKAEMDLKRIEIEALQEKARGEAQAMVFKLKSQSMSPELVEMERLKIEEIKWTNWDGKLPAIMGSGTAPIVDMRQFGFVASE